MDAHDILLFALNASREFGEGVARPLEMQLSEHEERDFGDGEHKSRPLVNVRNKHVFVIHSLYGEPGMSVNDKLNRLLFFVGALKDAAAAEVTIVAPYLCYARKDRKTKPRDPVTTRYVAALMEAVGAGRILTIDVHNLQAYQNAYRIQTEHLEARHLFARYFADRVGKETVAVLSPDLGGIKRAEGFRDALGEALGREIPFATMTKERSEGEVSGDTAIYGEVEGKTVIIIDDLISSGTTLARAAGACKKAGAKKVYAAATHGAFTEQANAVLAEDVLDKVVITNTIPPFRLEKGIRADKVEVLDAAPLFGEAIHRIWEGEPLTELLRSSLPEVVFNDKF